MPNIIVRVPSGVLDSDAKHRLVQGLNEAAADVEQIPDEPRSRAMCWVVIEEIAPGNWTAGGADITDVGIPLLVMVLLPVGVLDEATRGRYADAIYRVAGEALARQDKRLLCSCIFNEVPDGWWGINGALWSLADFTGVAGFRHLRHLMQ